MNYVTLETSVWGNKDKLAQKTEIRVKGKRLASRCGMGWNLNKVGKQRDTTKTEKVRWRQLV